VHSFPKVILTAHSEKSLRNKVHGENDRAEMAKLHEGAGRGLYLHRNETGSETLEVDREEREQA
jgi:hypothetical protein